MAKVLITEALLSEIQQTFDANEAETVLDKMESLADQPRKGKTVGNVGGVAIRELKHGKPRFYFLTDNENVKFASEDELASMVVKFVEVSGKKDQQETIEQVEEILESIGFDSI